MREKSVRYSEEVFGLFSGGKSRKNASSQGHGAPSKISRAHIDPAILHEIGEWIACHHSVEAYVEPETLVNPLTVVLVDAHGEYLRRPLGGIKGIDDVAHAYNVPVYDVEETGYPPRMRAFIERKALLKKREEQARRRAEFEAHTPQKEADK